ncbi:aspartyl-phosphate phosphatase Spo0E family protein [Inediibacterium massiliense]|uniref:aspartyl-phosphate phosphatase Spo0E family protein n=1 Tax=Inediibacterium massiliense TaxID=1658111 RepID=UPI000DA61F14|nr:aspartyl-phosphate phosphatase Spo0E family protein [Inediibacterium massiliense]
MKTDDYKIKNIKNEIEHTRSKLNQLVQQKKGNLLDTEVIHLSQVLDQLLSKYNHIKNN